MEISGKIAAILPQQSGMGRNGEWRSLDFILETEGQYPKKVCINLFNDKIDKFPMKVGDQVTVSFDVESREFNGRWYTTVRAWNVKNMAAAGGHAPADMPPPPSLNDAPGTTTTPEWRGDFSGMDNNNSNTDLPF